MKERKASAVASKVKVTAQLSPNTICGKNETEQWEAVVGGINRRAG